MQDMIHENPKDEVNQIAELKIKHITVESKKDHVEANMIKIEDRKNKMKVNPPAKVDNPRYQVYQVPEFDKSEFGTGSKYDNTHEEQVQVRPSLISIEDGKKHENPKDEVNQINELKIKDFKLESKNHKNDENQAETNVTKIEDRKSIDGKHDNPKDQTN